MFLTTAGFVCYSYAMVYGKGGTVQAVDSTKALVTTVLSIVCKSQTFNFIMGLGMVSGLLGAMVIVM